MFGSFRVGIALAAIVSSVSLASASIIPVLVHPLNLQSSPPDISSLASPFNYVLTNQSSGRITVNAYPENFENIDLSDKYIGNSSDLSLTMDFDLTGSTPVLTSASLLLSADLVADVLDNASVVFQSATAKVYDITATDIQVVFRQETASTLAPLNSEFGFIMGLPAGFDFKTEYGAESATVRIDTFVVPEPASLGLVGLGVAAFAGRRRRN